MSGYTGQVATVPLGTAGLFTDGPQSSIPASALIRANNVTYYNGVLQKDYGSRIWNSSALPAGIVRAQEMFVDSQSQNQRLFVLCRNGQIYRFTNYYTQTQITPTSTAPASLNALGYNAMVVGGNELVGNPKKLFTFTPSTAPQVIAGDAVTRGSMSLPAFDWTGSSQPFGGIVYRNRLCAWGNGNNPHAFYMSNPLNHEDFQTVGSALTFNVYPGEHDGIVCAAIFRGRLWVLKYPLGLYYLVDDDTNSANWFFAKQSDDFGACSPQSAQVVKDDLIIANTYGSFSSMKAALIFGDVTTADVFHQLGCYRFAEKEVRPDQATGRSVIYYGKKKQLLASFQSNVGTKNDRVCVVDYKYAESSPAKVAWVNKDQPNCLFTMRDSLKIPRPFYGADDGNIYQMDIPDRWVGSATDTTKQTAYLFDAQTPFIDFGQGDVTLASQVKTFEFLEIEYEPTGDFPLSVDVFIDGRFMETLTFRLAGRSNLGEMPLNSSVVDGLAGFWSRQQMHGDGRSVSLRFYNNGLGQDVRLVRAMIYYRLSGQQQEVA